MRRFPSQRGAIQGRLLRKCRELKLDLADRFHPHPSADDLGTDGIRFGPVLPFKKDFYYGRDELPTGISFMGSPKSGKTTAVCHVISEVQKDRIGVFCPDVRGDFLRLASRVPRALVIPAAQDRFNPFEPPPGVELKKWLHVVSARLTWDLGLQLASQAFVIDLFGKLLEQCERLGTIPTLLDFYRLLLDLKPRPRSSEEGYLERVLSRIRALLEVCGEEVFAVQKGFPILEALEDGRLVILDLKLEKFAADFWVGMRLYHLYYSRLYSADQFNQKTVLVVLDEQRSLIRQQSHEFGIPDIELLFSRSRALGIGFLVAEQIPSAVSPAVLTSTRLRLAFNTSPPESWLVGRLLGLDNEQTAELHKLGVGECITRLSGDRIPGPFRMQIPYPDVLR
jgi:hypothetical protein